MEVMFSKVGFYHSRVGFYTWPVPRDMTHGAQNGDDNVCECVCLSVCLSGAQNGGDNV